MSTSEALVRSTVPVLASTFPHGRGVPETGFLHVPCSRLTDRYDVSAPVSPEPRGGPEKMFGGVGVTRYRPARCVSGSRSTMAALPPVSRSMHAEAVRIGLQPPRVGTLSQAST